MKKSKLLFIMILLTTALSLNSVVKAQMPHKVSYQAVLRDSFSRLITDKKVGVKISIIFGSATGKVVYTETQTPWADKNGLINLAFGGTIDFYKIKWDSGSYFIKLETDPLGGTNYTITGTSQMLTVPYALHSYSAERLVGHYIGENFGGGVVFYTWDNGLHGLISATTDQCASCIWRDDFGSPFLVGAQSDGLNAGEMNTPIIIASLYNNQAFTNNAAKVCADYQNTINGITYGDWYLPSSWELSRVYNQKDLIGGVFGSGFYWSSTEVNGSNARAVYFTDGGSQSFGKNGNYPVRCIRAF